MTSKANRIKSRAGKKGPAKTRKEKREEKIAKRKAKGIDEISN